MTPPPNAIGLGFDHYKAALDEYRFQVLLNWSRSQYLLVFGTGVFGAGTGLVKLDDTGRFLTAGVFLVGLCVAVASILATRIQHDYYRAARDRVGRIEFALGIPEPLDTTPGSGGVRRLGKINNILIFAFVLLAVLDVSGVAFALWHDADAV